MPEFIPEIPENLQLEGNQNHVNLIWDSVDGYGPPIGGEAVSYKIYRDELLDFNIDDPLNGLAHIGTSSAESFTDSNLEDNTHYCYAVSGVNSEGAEGDKTSVICTETLSQLAASTPENLSASGGDQTVFIEWGSSIGSPPISYQIYRLGDGFTDEFIASTSFSQYNDMGLQKNTSYSYYVIATNELGSSEPSSTVSLSSSGSVRSH